MAEDKTAPVPADAGRINMGDAREIAYWTEKLRCTKAELVNAAGSVGPDPVKVQTYLRRK